MLNSNSKVNTINLIFAQKLGLYIWKTNIRAQKIDSSTLETFKIVIADFQVEDKVGRPRFFQKNFLVANTKFEVVLEMLFLKISNADVLFGKETLIWKSFTINKILPTIEQVQLIDLKEFVIAALDIDIEMVVI